MQFYVRALSKLSLVNSNINSKMYGCHFVMHAKMTVYFINMS